MKPMSSRVSAPLRTACPMVLPNHAATAVRPPLTPPPCPARCSVSPASHRVRSRPQTAAWNPAVFSFRRSRRFFLLSLQLRIHAPKQFFRPRASGFFSNAGFLWRLQNVEHHVVRIFPAGMLGVRPVAESALRSREPYAHHGLIAERAGIRRVHSGTHFSSLSLWLRRA